MSEPARDNAILFDWLSFTTNCLDLTGVMSLLGLYGLPFQEGKGMHGFRYRKYFEGISIHYDRDDGLVWLEMSGTGCRAFETYSIHKDWSKLFTEFINEPFSYNVTRLDVAYDDFKGVLNQDTMIDYMKNRYLSTKFRDYGIEHYSFVKDDCTLFFGSNKSDIYMRCYNKAAERGRDDIPHWVRFELQLRDDRAYNFIKEYMKRYTGEIQEPLGHVFASVVQNYVRFVEPSEDTNKSRWSTAPFWQEFVNSAEDIRLFEKKEVEYNEAKLQNYVFGQAGQAIDCALKVYGMDGFEKHVHDYLKAHIQNKNPKYDKLVEDLTGGTPF